MFHEKEILNIELMKAIAIRKSTRSYKSEQIKTEDLNTILMLRQ
ncbi:hypothetical protein [Clostridium sp.]|nr:hypothetical protein [Clostridium sp.]